MDNDGSGRIGFPHGGGGGSGGGGGGDPFDSSSWDQLVSIDDTSHMVHYQFGNGSLSEMVNSHRTNFPEANHQNAEDMDADSLPEGKRKRVVSESDSPLNPNKNVEKGKQKKSQCSKEEDESNAREPSKDDYIHMRAKRGQATNSHSLAERVRRERISERMRLLQELVPGCNKITGKAMMLDEIINYVQSLQQQVEFLSMKLSTVNPELNVDMERLLSKDILHSRVSTPANLALGPGRPFQAIPHGSFPSIHNIMPQYHSLPQSVWDNEFQSVLPMGFDSNPSTDLGPNAR